MQTVRARIAQRLIAESTPSAKMSKASSKLAEIGRVLVRFYHVVRCIVLRESLHRALSLSVLLSVSLFFWAHMRSCEKHRAGRFS
jgi:hypothetical protein